MRERFHDMKSTNRYLADGNAALAYEEAPAFILHEGRRHAEPQQLKKRSWTHGIAEIAVAVFVVALIGALWQVNDALQAARIRQAEASMATETYIVKPDDSLWSIASSHHVDGMSTQEMVDWIKETNGLDRSTIFDGQKLTVSVAQQ